ncbi:hypothetical protein [Achromobacter phage Motura]|uniref:Uncharacterized protein n=1 Tax=Achromobacter phage Motura TaxID=2591403 RepID=A0A514CSF3_9CAUD|nr:hypothetical protein H1O15_gp054 [Achromobacter phage Motura]QDH83408.1 hypothetical protein [Achromobacter phage Motura]
MTIGQKFKEPVKQTIIPIMEYAGSTGILHGFFPIAETTFEGTETTFEVEPGASVPLMAIRQPDIEESPNGYGAPELMVAFYNYEQSREEPWRGYANWVTLDRMGYVSRWVAPAGGISYRNIFFPGYLVASMREAMNRYNFTNPGPAPTPPDGEDGALQWINTVALSPTNGECAFFDFNWVQLFKSTPIPGIVPGSVVPTNIRINSNPAGGEFKAVVVQSAQSVAPGGGIVFDTIRVIKLAHDVEPGDYLFTFTIFANVFASGSLTNAVQVTKDVTLTLTVKSPAGNS